MKRSEVGTIAAWLAILILGYVLSIGPAISLTCHGVLPDECLVLYKPLEPARQIPVAGPLLVSYVEWWNPLHHLKFAF